MLHDVFLHPFPNPNMDAARWDAACDIAVEAVITQLALPATASPRAARQTAARHRKRDRSLSEIKILTVAAHFRCNNFQYMLY